MRISGFLDRASSAWRILKAELLHPACSKILSLKQVVTHGSSCCRNASIIPSFADMVVTQQKAANRFFDAGFKLAAQNSS